MERHCDFEIERINEMKRLGDDELVCIAKDRQLNENCRCEAIKLIRDESLLLDMLDIDDGQVIGHCIIDCLSSEETIIDLINGHCHILFKARALLNSHLPESFLKDFIKGCEEKILIEHAMMNPNFNDQDILKDHALNDSSPIARMNAAGKVQDQETLKEIALNDSDKWVRTTALSKIQDLNFFRGLMNTDRYYPRMLVDLTDNEDILFELAMNDETYIGDYMQSRSMPSRRYINPYQVRQLALEKLKSEEYFIRLFESMDDIKDGAYLFSGPNLAIMDLLTQIIGHIENQDMLEGIATGDSEKNVRIAAIRKIESGDMLADLALNDRLYEIRSEAVKSANCDEETLKKVIMTDGHRHVIAEAIKNPNLSDIDFLEGLAFSERNVINPKVVIERINDESVLVKIAYESPNAKARCLAAYRLTDEGILKEIALNDDDSEVKKHALANPNLCDEQFLYDFITNSDDEYVQLCAVKNPNLVDNFLLEEIAKNSGDFVADSAIDKIDDSAILNGLFAHIEGHFSRKALLKNPNFNDEEVLKEIALTDEDEFRRNHSIKNPNLKDQKVFYEIAYGDSSDYVRSAALERIEDNDVMYDFLDEGHELRIVAAGRIEDEKTLASIVFNDSSEFIRRIACRNPNLKDNEVFKRVIDRYPNGYLALDACSRITDEGMMRDILKDSGNENVRMRICRNPNLKDKWALCDVAKNDPDKSVRRVACSELKKRA